MTTFLYQLPSSPREAHLTTFLYQLPSQAIGHLFLSTSYRVNQVVMSSRRPRSSARTTRGMSSQKINEELENLQQHEVSDLEEGYGWESEHSSDSYEDDSDGET